LTNSPWARNCYSCSFQWTRLSRTGCNRPSVAGC
jgi:hypothetical protein